MTEIGPRPINSRYYNYCLWNDEKYKLYDYKRYGLLNKLMSHKIVNPNEDPNVKIGSKNEFLNIILYFVENSMVFLMEYVDRLKNFKNARWKNR